MSDQQSGPDRFAVPLYTADEAATYLDVPRSTFAEWTRGQVSTARGGAAVCDQPS